MAVADALVSKVLDLLTSVIASEIEQKVKLVVGIKKEVKMLTNNLQSIQAVLIDAERRQLKEETVKLWLHRLKDISYDIDDVLDEWSTEILKSKVEGDGYEHAAMPKRSKVWSFVLSFCFRFHEVGLRHDIAVKIMELNERLNVIVKEKDRYNLSLIQGNDQVIERNITTSFVDIKDVKGREHDKHAVIDLLLAKSNEKPDLHVISIVGMGGIGKTTLVKIVYNEVKSHFDLTIWVCVSDPFEEIRIAKAILESVVGNDPNLVELQNIGEKIHQCIAGKRFLLVLDDVWNEDSKKWEQVKQLIKCGSPGSKILVTTRKENVARIMGCRDIIRLGLLSNEQCWSIFSQIVFSESSIEHNRSLEGIGWKIVDRCKGLPLAVKTIAGLLLLKDSVEEWQSVLDSELWELEEVERDVLAPLWLSYYDLTSPLKQCFLSCVIYPKDHRMRKKELIGMWMSQGYLRETKGKKDLEMIGNEYFHNLVMRCFLQDLEETDYTNFYCKMHDIVHDFAQSLMKRECCSIELSSSDEEVVRSIDLRHVGITFGQEVPFPSSFYNLSKLRSLVVLSNYYYSHAQVRVALPQIFNHLTSLRSLNLSDCGIIEVPSNIGELVHLRQLEMSRNNYLKELPETICKLYNLQTLDVNWCRDLKSLPREIGKLVNLKCLYNCECWSLNWLPKGIGRLSGLQRLNETIFGNNQEGEGETLSLRDIKHLDQLGGLLRLMWRRQHVPDVDVEDAKEARLKEKKHLTDLYIDFCYYPGAEYWRKQQDEELLEALEPPPNLKSLTIYFYQGTKMCSPSWITSLAFLRKLMLGNWVNYEQLPAFGKLPWLEYLEFWHFRSVKKVGVEFYGTMVDVHEITAAVAAFPKLTELKFRRMYKWEEWEDVQGIKIMPCLRSLILSECPKLKALPRYILQNTSLKLKIEDCYTLQRTLH